MGNLSPRSSAPLPMWHMGQGALVGNGGCLPCAHTAGVGRWDRDLPQGRWSCPEQASLGAGAVPCDMVGTDLLWAPAVAVTPDLLWDPWSCCMSPCHLSTPLHFAFRGPLPCPRAGVYLTIPFIRCLSVKTTSTTPCKAHLSPISQSN